MQSITFAAPTLATAEMSRNDQMDILLNQATAAIVCCYLEHMNTLITKEGSTSASFISQTELVSIINNVQGALRTLP